MTTPREEIVALYVRRLEARGISDLDEASHETCMLARWDALLDWLSDQREQAKVEAQLDWSTASEPAKTPALDRRLLERSASTEPLTCAVCHRLLCRKDELWDEGTHCPRTMRFAKTADYSLDAERDCLRIGIEVRDSELANAKRENEAWRSLNEWDGQYGQDVTGPSLVSSEGELARYSMRGWAHRGTLEGGRFWYGEGASAEAAAIDLAEKLGLLTGAGNGGGGCGSTLLVEQADLFQTSSSCRDETDYFVTFKCSACGVKTDIQGCPISPQALPKEGGLRG